MKFEKPVNIILHLIIILYHIGKFNIFLITHTPVLDPSV